MDNRLEIKLKIYKELKVAFQTVDEQIKEAQFEKEELEIKKELYETCINEDLAAEDGEVVKKHLKENEAAIKECNKKVDDLMQERNAYRIEIEAYEQFMRDV